MESQSSQKKKDLLENWNRLLDWIKSCDTKASIVLAATGIFLTIFSSTSLMGNLNKILVSAIHHFNFANFLYLLFISIAFLLFIYGAYCLIKVLVPRLKKDMMNDDEMVDNSLFYFEGITKYPFSDFKNKILTISEEDECADIITQIYINAQICTIKYAYFKKGILYTFIGIASILILYLIGMVLLKTGGFY